MEAAVQRNRTDALAWYHLGVKQQENEREQKKDMEELSQRARDGKPLYGTSHQPEWIQGAAHRNSVFGHYKFSLFPVYATH